MLERAHDRKKVGSILGELLTETEQIMLAKRLAIILMLFGETPQHRIAEALLVSPTTVSKIASEIEKGKYGALRRVSGHEKIDIEKLVWQIMTASGLMPPRIGGKKYWLKYKK